MMQGRRHSAAHMPLQVLQWMQRPRYSGCESGTAKCDNNVLGAVSCLRVLCRKLAHGHSNIEHKGFSACVVVSCTQLALPFRVAIGAALHNLA